MGKILNADPTRIEAQSRIWRIWSWNERVFLWLWVLLSWGSTCSKHVSLHVHLLNESQYIKTSLDMTNLLRRSLLCPTDRSWWTQSSRLLVPGMFATQRSHHVAVSWGLSLNPWSEKIPFLVSHVAYVDRRTHTPFCFYLLMIIDFIFITIAFTAYLIYSKIMYRSNDIWYQKCPAYFQHDYGQLLYSFGLLGSSWMVLRTSSPRMSVRHSVSSLCCWQLSMELLETARPDGCGIVQESSASWHKLSALPKFRHSDIAA